MDDLTDKLEARRKAKLLSNEKYRSSEKGRTKRKITRAENEGGDNYANRIINDLNSLDSKNPNKHEEDRNKLADIMKNIMTFNTGRPSFYKRNINLDEDDERMSNNSINNVMSKSIAKQIKKTGSASFDGPKVKDRKKFAPATKVEKPKKGKGSYNRKKGEEDEEGKIDYSKLGTVPNRSDDEMKREEKALKKKQLGTVPLRSNKEMKREVKSLKKKQLGTVPPKREYNENTNIVKFIDSILTKNYAAADKYIKQAVECKLQGKIEQELSTPLF